MITILSILVSANASALRLRPPLGLGLSDGGLLNYRRPRHSLSGSSDRTARASQASVGPI
jgi:hypothetical protein